MTDLGKVIKAVEEAFDLVHSDFIGTDDFNETEWEQNKADALALLKEQGAMKECLKRKCVICPHCKNCDVGENGLLKEQEAVEPKWFIDAHNPAGAFRCSSCGERIVEKDFDFYCSKCGKPILWEAVERSEK